MKNTITLWYVPAYMADAVLKTLREETAAQVIAGRTEDAIAGMRAVEELEDQIYSMKKREQELLEAEGSDE